MAELVEWHVGYLDDADVLHIARDGAQTVFGESQAKQLVKKLGPPWRLFHWRSMLEPAEHEMWLKEHGETGSTGGSPEGGRT